MIRCPHICYLTSSIVKTAAEGFADDDLDPGLEPRTTFEIVTVSDPDVSLMANTT